MGAQAAASYQQPCRLASRIPRSNSCRSLRACIALPRLPRAQSPDQEQIFLVGYRKEKQIKEKDPMGLVNMKKKKRKDFTTAKDVKLNIDENLFFLCEEDKKYFQDHSFMSREEVKENILRWTNTMNDLKTPLAKKIFESIIREMKIGLDGMIKNEK